MDSFSFIYENFRYFLLAFFVYIIYLIWYHRDGSAIGTTSQSGLSVIPGSIPLIGNLPLVIAAIINDRTLEVFYESRTSRVDKSKPITFTVPFQRVIDVSDPVSLEYIQQTNFKNYEKGANLSGVLRDVLGDGIFAIDGPQWLAQRKAIAKIFTANSFRGIITTSVEKDLITLEKIIAGHAASGKAFDLSSLFYAFTLSSFTSFTFGHDVGSLESPTLVPFAIAFDYTQTVMNSRMMNPFWPIFERFTSQGKKMKSSIKLIEDTAFEIIDSREERARLRRVKGEEGGEKDLLELCMGLSDDKGKKLLTRKELRDATINLIIAGRDSTAQTLSWTFYRLLSEPSYIDDIRAEIDTVEHIDYDNFKNQKYTLAAFHEGLRLHPSVPKNLRIAKGSDVLPNGVTVSKGDRLSWCDWAMARDVDVWGEDAAEFKPERWIEKKKLNEEDDEEEVVLRRENMWKFHGFNAGPRVCPGQALAQYESTLVMSTILRNFDLDFAPGYLENVERISLANVGNPESTPRYSPSLTMPMQAPLMVIARARV